eukprot:symbB.v1.2.005911.t1/scaffold347.1/size224350/6
MRGSRGRSRSRGGVTIRIDDDFGTNSMPLNLNPGDDAESGAESETLGRRVEKVQTYRSLHSNNSTPLPAVKKESSDPDDFLNQPIPWQRGISDPVSAENFSHEQSQQRRRNLSRKSTQSSTLSINRNASSASIQTDDDEEPLKFEEFKERVLAEEMVRTKLFDACQSQLGKGTTMKNIGKQHVEDVGVKVALMVIILLFILSFVVPQSQDTSVPLVLEQLDLEAVYRFSDWSNATAPQDLVKNYVIWKDGLIASPHKPTLLYLDLAKRALCNEMSSQGLGTMKCSQIAADGSDVPWPGRVSLASIDSSIHVAGSPYRADDLEFFRHPVVDETDRSKDLDQIVTSVAVMDTRYLNEQAAVHSLFVSWMVIFIILVGMLTITRDLGHLSRKLLEPLRVLADEMQSIVDAVVDPAVDLLRLLDEDDRSLDESRRPISCCLHAEPLPEPAVPLMPVAEAQPVEPQPTLAVVGLVGRRPEEVLEQIYLCSAGEADLELGQIKGFHQPKDQIVFLCLDTSVTFTMDGLEDWEHLLKSGQLEVQKLESLLLLFSLCHVVAWFCPGAAPRLETHALKLLVKVQEFQTRCGLENDTSPLMIFVHSELKVPVTAAATYAKQRAHEALEKVLDNRWRTSLKRLKLLQDAKRSGKRFKSVATSVKGLFRVHRPCAVAMGREATRRDPIHLASAWVEEPSTAVDRLRSRLSDAVEEAKQTKRDAMTLEEWLPNASALQLRLHETLSAAARLPEELAVALGEAPGHGPMGSPEMCWSLGSWAFPELFFAFNSAQEAIDEACQTFSANLAASPSMDPQDLLRVAQQLVQKKTYAPMSDYAVRVSKQHCERMVALARQRRCSVTAHGFVPIHGFILLRPPCKSRGASGRPCSLLEGHKEPHRNNFRACKVCLCGKSQVQLAETFEAPKAAKDGLPPFGACCHNANFLPFLPDSCDFDMDPVLVPPSPRLAKIHRGGHALAALPSALPEANGFVALVADAPEGARLPGFGEQFNGMSRWRLPGSGPPGPSSKDVYIGVEYLCPLGHRFFAPPPKYSGLDHTKESEGKRRSRRKEQGPTLDEGDVESVPLCGYRLYVPCVQHRRHKGRGRGEPPCVAQLSRIWVQTPQRKELIEAEPRIAMVDTKGEVGVDGRTPEVVMTGGKVVLPAGMLVQLVLPCAYYRGSAKGDLPSFWELGLNEAERCRLLLGKCRVTISTDLAHTIVIFGFYLPAHINLAAIAKEEKTEVTQGAEEVQLIQHIFNKTKVAIISWGRYVPWPVVQNLLVAGVQVKPQLEEREVSLFFSDMAGFTSIVEQLVPEQTLVLLSRYFNDMSKIIESFDGVVIEYIGDAILAVFGAPAKLRDHALACVRATLKMQRGVQKINHWSHKKGLPHVSIRCGIHSGWVSFGNLGFHSRLKFGVIGDHSNVPAKLEELNKTYGTPNLISQATYDRLPLEEFVIRPIDFVDIWHLGASVHVSS